MASALRSVFLTNDESIRFYLRVQLPRYGGYSKGVVDSKINLAMIKMWSNRWGSRYQKLLRAHKVCSCVDTENTNLFSHGLGIFSTCRKWRNLPQVTKTQICSCYLFFCSLSSIEVTFFQGKERNRFLKETILITWKQWSQYTKVAIVLIFTLFLIPKADAADSLKTCSCLLKECRYYIHH